MNRMSLIKPNWPAPPYVKAFSTTRLGGVSPPPYDSLNLGEFTEETEQNIHSNRRLLYDTCDFQTEPCWLQQVHGTMVFDDVYDANHNQADAMITRTPHRICVVLTADCLPILLYGDTYCEVAAIHAGWRSLAGGIIKNTLSCFKTESKACMAWLGPCIGPSAFEVGEEVKTAFSLIDKDHESGFISHGQKWLADLQQLAINQLVTLGLTQIHRDKSCTFSEKNRFFSYRRDKTTGRMGSFIWLCDDKPRGRKT